MRARRGFSIKLRQVLRGALFAFVLTSTSSSPSAGEAAGGSLEQLAWLAGCWERQMPGRVIQEQWMAPLGRSMLGMSRTVVGGKTVAYEYIRIEELDGLVYTAVPSGQRETAFKQLELTDSSVVFSNPEHDFPQRIRYRRLEDGSLLAQIEGDKDGKTRVIDFPMKRGQCGLPPAAPPR